MEIDAEGFSDMAENELRDHLEDNPEVLSNEQLEELTRSSTNNDDDDDEQAQILMDKILEYDPNMERALTAIRGITAALAPLHELFDEAKKRQRQLPITVFLKNTSSTVEQPITSSEVGIPSSSTSRLSIKIKARPLT
uniref:Uncharacterized protein n=1 Tax=Trichuris muris TaxID=70415 RepID=A0A5S6QMB1_TRIMR